MVSTHSGAEDTARSVPTGVQHRKHGLGPAHIPKSPDGIPRNTKRKASGPAEGSNAFSKHKKVVHMDDSDEDAPPLSATSSSIQVGGHVNGRVRHYTGKGQVNGVNGLDDAGATKKINGFKPVLNGAIKSPKKKKSYSVMNEDAMFNELQHQRRSLPIAQGKDALIDTIKENDVTVLLGETGSGKTTQVPQYILESGMAETGMIAVTQPRRVAATTLAARVSAETNTTVGDLVGYAVRFDENYSSATRIKYATDGMLMRELLTDPLLSNYSVIVVDEAHERTLRTDFLLANLKKILVQRNGTDGKGKSKPRNPLKVVVMSATLDAEKISQFFNDAKVVYVQGRQHPVRIYHTATGQTDYVDAALRTFFQIHLDQPSGDVLIFLPGQEDIESLEKAIKIHAKQLPVDSLNVDVCPMYAAQTAAQQSRVFKAVPKGHRKCILATNIAETSITIPGVRYVIDTGLCKVKRYVAYENGGGYNTLLSENITKSSALQRAGRAGREGPGKCFRLYTNKAFEDMAPSAEPEIKRSSLASSTLQMRCVGYDLEDIEFMDRPDDDTMFSALKHLFLLGALDQRKHLTSLGRRMGSFPIEPTQACAIIAAAEAPKPCVREILDIISITTSSSQLFLDITDARETAAEARRKFRHASGDHLTILNVLRAYREVSSRESAHARKEWCKSQWVNERCLKEAQDIREQLRVICERLKLDSSSSCGDEEEPILECITRGLPLNAAFLQPNGTYKQVIGQTIVKIHPSSVLFDKKVPAIVFDELVHTNRAFARGVSSVPRTMITSIPTFTQRRA